MRIGLIVALLLGSLSSQVVPDAPEPRVIDKKFIAVNSIMLAGAIADGWTTYNGLKQGCYETSILYGKHPSAAKQFGIQTVEIGAVLTAAYYFKKWLRHGQPGVEQNAWMILPLLDGAVHGLAGAVNHGVRCR